MLSTIQRNDAAAVWRARARDFILALPENEEGPERAMAFRALLAAASESEYALRLLCAVYELAAESSILAHSVHDARMVVASVTERIELLPILEGYVERFLARRVADDSPLRGLWQYVRELYQVGHDGEGDSPERLAGVH